MPYLKYLGVNLPIVQNLNRSTIKPFRPFLENLLPF